MKVREVVNRLAGGNLVGLIVIVPNDGRSAFSSQEIVLRFYSGGHVWFIGENDRLQLIEAKDMLEWEVSNKSLFLRNGDESIVDGTKYGLSEKEKIVVVEVKEGDASPYPVEVKFKNGRRGQFKLSELRTISNPGAT